MPQVNAVRRWGRREITALRNALRLDICGFAKKLGVSRRTAFYWEQVEDPARPSRRKRSNRPKYPSPESQHYLDLLLERSDDAVRQRFLAGLEAPHCDDPWQVVETVLTGRMDATVDPGHAARVLELSGLLRSAQGGRQGGRPPGVVLVAGFAGSGKTELGRFLAALTGWVFLDNDIHLCAVVENELRRLGGDPSDRDGPLYLEGARPVEYELMLQTIECNLRIGASVVACASFVREVTDRGWLTRLQAMLDRYGASSHIVWVTSDLASMHAYLVRHGAARYRWKLDHWDQYVASLDLALRPAGPYVVVNNSESRLLPLLDSAGRYGDPRG